MCIRDSYKTGRWIAFYKNDMEAVIDMQQPTEISSASISTCCLLYTSARKRVKVACVGNSITYGIGVSDPDKESYPARLQQMLGERCV